MGTGRWPLGSAETGLSPDETRSPLAFACCFVIRPSFLSLLDHLSLVLLRLPLLFRLPPALETADAAFVPWHLAATAGLLPDRNSCGKALSAYQHLASSSCLDASPIMLFCMAILIPPHLHLRIFSVRYLELASTLSNVARSARW